METWSNAPGRAPTGTESGTRSLEELLRSRDALADRVEAERALRRISARISRLGETESVLQEVVDEARRLLGSDGAHLALKVEGEAALEPRVVAGIDDPETQQWLRTVRLQPGSGTNGLAASLGEPVWTSDYRVDPRLPHGPDYGTVAERLHMVAIAAVPMHGPEGDVVGTLSISFETAHDFAPEEIELLQALADQAAIAVLNSRLFERLRDSEARYRLLVDHAPDLVFAVDARGHFTFLSETCERLTGWTSEELCGLHFATVVHPNSLPEVEGRFIALPPDPGAELRLRFLQLKRDGTASPVEVRARPIVHEGAVAGYQGAVRDVTEFDRLEQDRRLHMAELAVAQERSRLARELHDSVTQALFSMTLTTHTVGMLLDRGDTAAALQRLTELEELQRDALGEMRALVFALRPASLDRDGLVQALRTYAAAIERRSRLPITLELDEVDRLPEDVEDALYRITQEALHNITKHARAGSARVRLVIRDRGVLLEVSDDGVGFDPAAVPGGHLGVAGMRARAGLIGGRLEIESSAGQGTRLTVRLTIPR